METHPAASRDEQKRSVSRALRAILYASVFAAAALVLLLVFASSNTAIFEQRYTWLLYATTALAAILFVLVLEFSRRLLVRYRAGVFGTRLTVRLALALIAMTLVPASFIYVISVQVLGRSIESWFDVPVERALESGLNLGRAALDAQIADLSNKARRIEFELGEVGQSQWPTVLDKVRDQLGLQDVIIVTFSGRIVAASGTQYAKLAPDFPTPTALRQLRATRQFTAVEGGEGSDKSLRVRALRLMLAGQPTEDQRILQLIQTVPSALADNAEAVQRGQRDYQELSLARQGLKRIYRVTLTLTLILTIFSAIAAAFLLAGWLTGPLTQLAAGTRAVAAGDFRPMRDYSSRDELGTLTESFNLMTRQLGDARAQVQRQQDALIEANVKLEGVLTSINVGVLLFDQDFRLELANEPARVLIGEDTPLGERMSTLPWIGRLAPVIQEKFAQLEVSSNASRVSVWELQTEMTREIIDASTARPDPSRLGYSPHEAQGQIWLFKGMRLIEDRPNQSLARIGYLVVMDEITAMLSAQRASAWSEVARRLAHEIKNPLTPIQLAAERLEQKLTPRLNVDDAQLMQRSTSTIVSQVTALKQMVDEFREYARLPSAQLGPVRLGDVVQDVLSLYADSFNGVQISTHFDPAVPRVIGDAGQLRQIVHNLVKNASEALEGSTDPRINVLLEAVRQPTIGRSDGVQNDRRVANVTGVRLIVRDNGPGFSTRIANREFEPYVTTKPKGTGLGLAIVKKIVDDHAALIELGENATLKGNVNVGPGAQISILFTRLQDNRGSNVPNAVLQKG
jgi:nitrogen fixation/metabolism regulation signal transduction histidine kinase